MNINDDLPHWKIGYAAVQSAVTELEDIKEAYKSSKLDPAVVCVRVRSLESKIAQLKDVKWNPAAHPWNEDNIA